MTTRSDPAGGWRKSTYSGSGNNCVEVNTSYPGIAVRDSNNPHGPVLTFTTGQWRAFTRTIRTGSHGPDRPR
jgi:uncharacterized protein DUF397